MGFLIGEIGDLGGDGEGRGGRVVGGRRWASPLLGGAGRGKREKKRGNRRESRNTQRRAGEQGDSSGLSWASGLGKCVYIGGLAGDN